MILKSNDIKELLEKIYANDFTKSDIAFLFVLLRPQFSLKGNSMLLDVANFITHADKRNQGVSYNYIHSFTDNLIQVSEVGGIIKHKAVFSKQKIIEQLIKICNSTLSFKVFNNQIRKRTDKVVGYLTDLMDNVEFEINDPRVKESSLKMVDNIIYFQLRLSLKGPLLKTSEDTIILLPLFE